MSEYTIINIIAASTEDEEQFTRLVSDHKKIEANSAEEAIRRYQDLKAENKELTEKAKHLKHQTSMRLSRAEKAEAENTALKSELEALRCTEDCTEQEIEIRQLKEAIVEVLPILAAVYEGGYDSQISDDLFNIIEILKDRINLLPDAGQMVKKNQNKD